MSTDNNKNKQKITSVGGDAQKLESLSTIDRIRKMCNRCQKQYGSSSKIQNRIAMWSRHTYTF